MGKKIDKLGSQHLAFLERIRLYGSTCTMGACEVMMVQTTLTRMGLVRFEKVGERTLRVFFTEAGAAAVVGQGEQKMHQGGTTPRTLATGCTRHYPKTNS